MIKAKDLRLYLINVVVLGFLNPGPGPQGVLEVEPLFQYKAKDEVTPSQQPPKMKKKKKKKK